LAALLNEPQLDPELEPWISATQIDTFELCNRKWAWRWLEKIAAPPNKFAQLGLDTHGPMENWLKRGEVPTGSDKASLLAQALIPYVPPPQSVEWQNVEREELLEIDDVLFVVKIDLSMPAMSSWNPWTNSWDGEIRPRTYDHKTCGTFDWCVTPETIQDNPQAALYAAWTMVKYASGVVDVQWNYVRTKGAIQVNPVFATITAQQISERMRKNVETGRAIKHHLSQTKRALDVVHNPLSCEQYGGCPYKDRCNLTSEERIMAIMSNGFQTHPTTQAMLGGLPNPQGGNGMPQAVNPPQLPPPPNPSFSGPQMPPMGQFSGGPPGQLPPPPGGGLPPPPQQQGYQQQPLPMPPQQGGYAPQPQQQYAPPPPPPQQQYAAPPPPPPQQQYAPPPPPPQQYAAPPPPPPQQYAAPPQPPPAQTFVPPNQQQQQAPQESAGRGKGKKANEHNLDGAWQRFFCAHLPFVNGDVHQAGLRADASVAELKGRQ
jgi:hypothetical protein